MCSYSLMLHDTDPISCGNYRKNLVLDKYLDKASTKWDQCITKFV